MKSNYRGSDLVRAVLVKKISILSAKLSQVPSFHSWDQSSELLKDRPVYYAPLPLLRMYLKDLKETARSLNLSDLEKAMYDITE